MQKLKYILLSCFVFVSFSFFGCSAANTSEVKSTSTTFHQRWIVPNPNATSVPEYVTAWPKQVAVEKPDPVLGDKLVWEHWIYNEEFAKLFDGFPVEKADKELKSSPIKAIVLRVFKKNLWEGVNPNFPEQYTVDIDLYFDDMIKIPLSERLDTNSTLRKYPKGVEASFKKLVPMKQNDKKSLEKVIPTAFALNQGIYIFITPIDGRFTALGRMYYYPTIVSGLSCITLRTGQTRGTVAPLQKNGALWFSLFGDRSFDVQHYPTAIQGSSGLYKQTDKVFEQGEHPENKGYVKLPYSFYEVALPKMTLVKALNVCIVDKQHLNKASKEAQEDLLKHCQEIEETGVIYDLHNNQYGLSDSGF